MNNLSQGDLIVFDVDNTLTQNWGVYDEAYRQTSRQILGQEFIMTRRPDGTEDRTFSRMSNPQILEERLTQLSINPKSVNFSQFFTLLGINATRAAHDLPTNIYGGVEEFLYGMKVTGARLALLSSGPIKLQLAALRPIVHYFDLSRSLFLGDFKNKREALERIAYSEETRNFVCFGDAPSDMEACACAGFDAMLRIGVGVVISGLVESSELISSGADFILSEYSPKSLAELKERMIG